MQPPEEGSTTDFRFCCTVDRVQATNGLSVYTYTKCIVYESAVVVWTIWSVSGSFAPHFESSTDVTRRLRFYVVICSLLCVCVCSHHPEFRLLTLKSAFKSLTLWHCCSSFMMSVISFLYGQKVSNSRIFRLVIYSKG